MTGGILESYRRISLALTRGLEKLEIKANAESQYGKPEGTNPYAAVCFEVPSNYEITADGKKLIGSAQARRSLGVLQHGSLPLFGDLTRITEVLKFETLDDRAAAARRLLNHATTAETILGVAPTWKSAAESLKQAFQEQIQGDFVESQPSLAEIERAQILEAEKYANPDWTYRI